MPYELPENSKVVRLYKHNSRDELIACEAVEFLDGAPAIETTLRRAALSGRVDVEGEIDCYFADILDENGDLRVSVALDRGSYGALKNHWMRCRLERP